MIRNGGWIPPERIPELPAIEPRTRDQMYLTEAYADQVRTFGARMQGTVDEPERVLLHDLETQTTGGLLPRIWQVTGSCVGAAAARSYSQAMAGDVVHRGDHETVKIPFPYATYGVGRELGGMRRPGEGSFGAVQAQACGPDEFGILEWDDDRVPRPTIRDGWAQWTADQEKQWSHPNWWPVPRRELEPTAKAFGLYDVTQAKTTGELVQALAQGYGATVASNFGTRSTRIEGDVAIAPWNSTWAHQMSVGGYWKHPRHGLLFEFDNQWGPSTSIHTPCPTLLPMGIVGSFWMRADDMHTIMNSRYGEVFVHTSTGGFPLQKFDWGDMGWHFT